MLSVERQTGGIEIGCHRLMDAAQAADGGKEAERAAARFERYTRIFGQIYDAPALNARIDEIQAPTLLVWGAEDRVLHPSGAQAWMERHPNSELQVLPEVGHLPMMEAPEKTAEALLAFHAERFGGGE